MREKHYYTCLYGAVYHTHLFTAHFHALPLPPTPNTAGDVLLSCVLAVGLCGVETKLHYTKLNTAGDVLLSCVLAVGVNVTNYQVLTHTSPITFQVQSPTP